LEHVSETEQPLIAASLWLALANLLVYSGKRSYGEAERAMHIYETVGDLRGKALAQRHLAFVLYEMGQFDAANDMIERAIAAFREWGDVRGVGPCFNMQAMFANARGDRRAGRELYAQALKAFQMCGNESGAAVVLSNLGELEFNDGNVDRALQYVNEALAIDLRGKNAANISTGYANSAAYRIAAGDLVAAREAAREGLRWAREAKSDSAIKLSLQHLAQIAALCGDTPRAATLLGYVDAKYAELGLRRGATERRGYEQLTAALRKTLSENQIGELSAEGAAWTEDRAVEEALNVECSSAPL
jgi:tetratricopeptide (TPR) repeat protein